MHMQETISKETSSSPSVFLASLGWIITAGVIVWFFVLASSAAYDKGWSAGIADQNVEDQAVYEQAFGSLTQPADLNNVLQAKVMSVSGQQLIVKEIVLAPNFPFAEQAEEQAVIIDGQTRIVLRQILGPDEYEQRREQADQAGQNPMLVPPYEDVLTAPESLEAGQRVEITARTNQDVASSSFIADEIAIIDIPLE